MGGLYNRKVSGRSSTNRVTSRLTIPTGAKAGLQYMKMHNLLSKNPQGSGGVGKVVKSKPCNCGTLGKPEVKEDTTLTLGEVAGKEDIHLGASTPCPAGTSSVPAAYPCGGLCAKCPTGTSSVAGGLCAKCPAGTSSVAGGLCAKCPAGTSSAPGGLCIPSAVAGKEDIHLGASTPCPAGTSSVPAGGLCYGLCAKCPAGTSSVAGGVCAKCPAGTSSVAGGLCAKCPAGATSVAGGVCVPCPAGMHSIAGGLCTPCPAGTYSIAGGVCTACPAGTSSVAGATACIPCTQAASKIGLCTLGGDSSTLAETVWGCRDPCGVQGSKYYPCPGGPGSNCEDCLADSKSASGFSCTWAPQ